MHCKKIYGRMLLSLVLLVFLPSFGLASEGESFSHPRIGENPHESLEQGEGHRRFRKEHPDPHSDSFGKEGHHGFSAEGLNKSLHLDEEQTGKMREVIRNYRKGVILKQADLRVAQLELDASVADGNFVMADIEKLVAARESAASALTLVRIHALAEAKSFLSIEQFRQFMGRVTHRMRKGRSHGRRGGKRHHGGEGKRHHTERRHGEGSYEDYKQ